MYLIIMPYLYLALKFLFIKTTFFPSNSSVAFYTFLLTGSYIFALTFSQKKNGRLYGNCIGNLDGKIPVNSKNKKKPIVLRKKVKMFWNLRNDSHKKQ